MQTDPPDRSPHDDGARADLAVALAERLLRQATTDATRAERWRQGRLGRLVNDAAGRDLVHRLTDEVLRVTAPERAAQLLRDVVLDGPAPASLGLVDRLLLGVGGRLAPRVPRVVIPLARRRILAETRGVVLPAEDPAFARHAARRRSEGTGLIVNVLGEAILGDDEAARRLADVIGRLARPDVDAVSVKISALVANLDVLAFDHEIARIAEPLRALYRAAMAHQPAKFVNLDMEEYRDLHLTIAAFQRVLDEPEFVSLEAGIVLQAYLPDSHACFEDLARWAVARRAQGGAGIKIRLVKGANLAMEAVEAELKGWTPAPYATKAEVDASYKALLDRALDPQWRGAVRVAVASHNLFDVAWALVRRNELGADDRNTIEIEMLEGMAPAQARAVQAEAGALRLYAPIVAADQLDASIAYLARRLDENTAPENFLRALFSLTPGSAEFADQERRFRQAVADRHSIDVTPRRRASMQVAHGFVNEPDADPTSAEVRERVNAALGAPPQLAEPVLVDTIAGVDAAVGRAADACEAWGALAPGARREVLLAVADMLSSDRFETLAVMAAEAGKTVREGDPEVSEAVDFARYYATVGLDTVAQQTAEGARLQPRGVVVVASPWNFPYAIPAGGLLAALAAGNAVLLKPPPQARRTAQWLASQLWRAGVPEDVLQYVPCPDDDVGRRLITHERVATVILTGGYETAGLFRGWKPGLHLLAETSGKNALVITQAADIDQAIRDLVRSAFGHAGQKCSAASLGIIEAPLYDDSRFLARLADAVTSLSVGPAEDLATMVGPLVEPPGEKLTRGLTQLDDGERWLVQPRQLGERQWTPGVRTGVRPGSWFHQTECFGPVLGLMRAADLDHAIELQNGTPYGLTGGIHSLDETEIERWLERVEVGNAYVNRATTGAIVQRQPFGGWKRSAVGCGPKAGGPDYVAELVTAAPVPIDLAAAERSYRAAWQHWFSRAHDPTGLASERNELSYRPLGPVVVRVGPDTPPGSLDAANVAAGLCSVPVVVSDAADEADDALAGRLSSMGVERVRLLTGASDRLLLACHDAEVGVDYEPVSPSGCRELRRWLREQAVSRTLHRHGRLPST